MWRGSKFVRRVVGVRILVVMCLAKRSSTWLGGRLKRFSPPTGTVFECVLALVRDGVLLPVCSSDNLRVCEVASLVPPSVLCFG